jgi:GTPase SAR1 family protein
VIVYDVTDEKSFDDVKMKWIKDALVYCDAKQVFVLGNKCDNKFQEGIRREHQQWAREMGVNIVGVSAKTGNNVNQFFENLTKNLMQVHPKL